MLRPDPQAPPVRRRGDRWGSSLEHLAVLVALVALLRGYSTVVESGAWALTIALVTGLTVLASLVLRTLRVPFAGVLGAVVGAGAVLVIFVPQTLVAGVVPTSASVVALRELLARAQVLIMEEAAPAPAAGPVVLVLTLAFLVLAVTALALLRLRRGVWLVGLLLLAVLVVPAMISGRPPAAIAFVVPAAAWLAVLWARSGPPRAPLLPAAVAAATGLLAAVVVPPVLPDVTSVARDWGAPPPAVFGDGINPMLQLGQNLRRGETSVAATYTTTLEKTPYLRAAVLRDFNGRTWRPVGPDALGRAEGALVLREDIPAEPQTTAISVVGLRSTMLPVPYPATRVSGLSQEWSWNRVGQTLGSTSGDSEGQEYEVTSLEVQPTAEQMRGLGEPFRGGLQDYLQLPAVPSIVSETAAEVTADADTDYDRALALQEHFRSRYQYSETAPVAGDYDGNGIDVLETFLQERSGYCVHFSSAMAVMARVLDIPSRVVVGYAPGRAVGFDEDEQQVYEVTSDDLHAWPELYFEGVGWVGFEPTPSVGTTTAFEEPQDPDAPAGEVPYVPRDTPEAPGRTEDVVAPVVDDEAPSGVRSVAVALVAVVGLLLTPGALRLVLRRRRLASDDPATWWSEAVATGVDHGLQLRPSDTPRRLADALAELGAETGSLEALREGVEVARYARTDTVVATGPDDARRVVSSLCARGSRRERLAAALLPRSLWGGSAQH